MISDKEAYDIIRKHTETPITYMLEAKTCYLTTGDKLLSVSKATGRIEEIPKYADFMLLAVDGKHLLPNEMFDDFLTFYRKNSSEASLAELYAMAWNRLCFHADKAPDIYKNKEEHDLLVHGWEETVRILHSDIIARTELYNLNHPPCVRENPEDPFYMAKPFMLKNGWTTNNTNRTWIYRPS